MWSVACLVIVLAAAPPAPISAPPQGADRFPSEDAVRHYAQGRLLEERGLVSEALGEYYRALRADPDAADVACRVSELLAGEGEQDRALEFARRALAARPGYPRALWLEGSALFHLGRGEEALESLTASVDADSSDQKTLRTLARAAESEDRFDLVARAYRRLTALDDGDEESWFQLAAAEARMGHVEAADSALEQTLSFGRYRPGLYFLEGWIRESEGRSDDAIAAYRKHLLLHPDDQVSRRRLVNLLATGGQVKEAYGEARKVAAAEPDDPEAVEVAADLAYRAGHAREGRDALARLRRAAPDDPDRVLRSAVILARNGRAGEGVKLARAWVDRHPGRLDGELLGARAHLLAGDTTAVVQGLDRAIALAPDSLGPRVMLGRLQETRGRYAEASEAFRQALELEPEATGVALELAGCRESLGDVDGAERVVRQVLAREPENPSALNFLGYLLADHDQHLDEAEDLIRRALAHDPDNGAYVDSMGWVYYRLGRLAQARHELERAVRLTGGDPVVHEHLGDVYKDMRLFDLARQQYRLSLNADSTNARVRRKLEAIR